MNVPREFQTPKRLLFRIHKDIRSIVSPLWSYHRLTELEILVLLLEDRRFFNHFGVDFKSSLRDTWRMITFRKHGGASTIDMQYVRTRTGYKDRTFRRKLYEMSLAILIQYRMSKIAILRSYLNEVFLGSGLYGIHIASWRLFQKSSSELTVEEAAIIAAMMVYPRPLNPSLSWEEKINRRANYGLRLFERFGWRYKKGLE
jgi:membrane peptidoglycan carboxypeptidase